MGTWQSSQGSTGCDTADPGHYVDSQAASMQIACFAGTYNPNSGSVTSADCITADAGSYVADSGSAEQLLCSAEATNQHQDSLVVSKQTLVIMFKQSQSNWMFNGFLSGRERRDTMPTLQNRVLRHSLRSSQTACLAGTYNPSTGSTSSNDCMDTAPGFFVENVGSASQQACELATIQQIAVG